MRFHIPTNELAGDMDAVEAFHQQVMNKASVISVSGDAIAIFRELQCLTPRYDIFYIFLKQALASIICWWRYYQWPPVTNILKGFAMNFICIYCSKNSVTVNLFSSSGRYDIKVFQTFFQLHGKTFDYKIPMSTVLRLFLLPHKDMRQMFFVVSLDPPIKQGQTRYHYLVLLFGNEEETSLELPFTE